MSVQQSKQILQRYGLVLVAVGGWKHEVYQKSGEKVQEAMNPEQLSRYVAGLSFEKRLARVHSAVVSPSVPLQNLTRVWRLR
jgi:hypothetical protein